MRLAEMHVVAGVIQDGSGRVLIAQRPRGRHMAGRWEFPGGKLQPGEDPLAGLRREFYEELGVTVQKAQRLITLRHDYSDRRVRLEAWSVTAHEGTPVGLDSQALAWVVPEELIAHDLLEADRPIVTALRLPQLAELVPELPATPLRAPAQAHALLWRFHPGAPAPAAQVVSALRRSLHPVFVLGDGVDAMRAAVTAGAVGVIVGWSGRAIHVDPQGQFLVGVQCQDLESCRAAAAGGAHFLLLTPNQPITEAELEQHCQEAGVPIWVGWYANGSRLERLRRTGAHGCAIMAAAKPA